MARNSKSIRLYDFSGGLNTSSSPSSLQLNEASDLQNINLLATTTPAQAGFTARLGNTAHNASAMVGSSTAIHGMNYFRLSSGSDFLTAVAGTKFYADAGLTGTMTDRTGAVTITTGQDNIWTGTVLNDKLILVGGAPDAPLKYTGSGNIAALGGSPPSGNFGLTSNNYFFIGNTSSNPSRIQWSILGDPEDWSSTGSGSQDVSKNDGDTLIGAAVIDLNHMLLFKQNSIHDLITTTPPFPLFPKFRGVGAVSKRGIVTVDGMVYFITPQPRMKATDGNRIYNFPDTIDTVWDALNVSRLKYIHGVYYPKREQILWFCSYGTATTHDYCIIWDLKRKCWLRHTTGYKMNVSGIVQDYLLYSGAYDGKLYKQDVAQTYTDASETSATISAYWRSGWYDFQTMIQSKVIPYFEVSYTSQSSGTFEVSYGYDFIQDRGTSSLPMKGIGDSWGNFFWDVGMWAGQTDSSKYVFPKGGGKFFQFLIRHRNEIQAFSFNGLEIPVKIDAPTAMR